jgi:hypothetical protein
VDVDFDSGSCQGFVLAGAAFFAVGKDVIEQKAMPISDPLRRQSPSGDEAHHCGPTDPKKIGGLLSGEFHRLRSDGYRLARVKCRYYLNQCLVYRPGQLDPVVLFGSHKGITWRGRSAAEALMGRQETDHRSKFVGILWNERRGLTGFRTHDRFLPALYETYFATFE